MKKQYEKPQLVLAGSLPKNTAALDAASGNGAGPSHMVYG